MFRLAFMISSLERVCHESHLIVNWSGRVVEHSDTLGPM